MKMYSTHTSLFLRSKNASPLASRGIYLIVFYEVKNATALAGAEVFTSLFITKQKLHFYDIESCLLSCLVKQIQLYLL